MFNDVKLKQKNHEGFIEIDLLSNKKLKYSKKSLLQNHEYIIDISHIDPIPVGYRNIPKGQLTWAIVCGIFSIFFVAVSISHNEIGSGKHPFLGMSVMLLIASATLFSIVHRKYVDLYIFRKRSDGSNLFAISKNKPSSKIVSNFISELENRIKSIRYDDQLTIEEKCEIYKKHLEFLYSEGVLSKESHEEALENVSKKGKKASVFNIVSGN